MGQTEECYCGGQNVFPFVHFPLRSGDLFPNFMLLVDFRNVSLGYNVALGWRRGLTFIL